MAEDKNISPRRRGTIVTPAKTLFILLMLLSACSRGNEDQHPVNSNPWRHEKNIYLQGLQLCSLEPMTGFLRNGYCETNANDEGSHTVCAIITDSFLQFTLNKGNDLISAQKNGFPGLKRGEKWCVCAEWWRAAELNGPAPSVDLRATHIKSLQYISKAKLLRFAQKE